jgi:hypothetical protein
MSDELKRRTTSNELTASSDQRRADTAKDERRANTPSEHAELELMVGAFTARPAVRRV